MSNTQLHNAQAPMISICIPAYKRVAYLTRLLDSLVLQSFRDFEVIISDDSNDQSVSDLAEQYRSHFSISYYKNNPSLGTPGNWNFAISKARGEWIKLMHDDDWFVNAEALQGFVTGIKTAPTAKFIFSAYTNQYLSENRSEEVIASAIQRKRLAEQPYVLVGKNVIGPPSVTIVHRSVTEIYDVRMKWLVDIDFYVRVLTQNEFSFIPHSLINVGIGDEQVTAAVFRRQEVEIPEAFLFLEKYGTSPLRNIWVYDAWWRFLRNLDVKTKEQLLQYSHQKEWPNAIYTMLRHKQKLPEKWLHNGWFSKTNMFLLYLTHKSTL